MSGSETKGLQSTLGDDSDTLDAQKSRGERGRRIGEEEPGAVDDSPLVGAISDPLGPYASTPKGWGLHRVRDHMPDSVMRARAGDISDDVLAPVSEPERTRALDEDELDLNWSKWQNTMQYMLGREPVEQESDVLDRRRTRSMNDMDSISPRADSSSGPPVPVVESVATSAEAPPHVPQLMSYASEYEHPPGPPRTPADAADAAARNQLFSRSGPDSPSTATTPPTPVVVSFSKSVFEFFLAEFSWGHSTLPRGGQGPTVGDAIHSFLGVPVALEGFIVFGILSCTDVMLHHLIFLPIRSLWASVVVLLQPLAFLLPPGIAELRRAHIYDLLRGFLVVCSVLLLAQLPMSRIYHYIRSGGASVKLYVMFNILEVFDKLLASIGHDIGVSFHDAVKRIRHPDIRRAPDPLSWATDILAATAYALGMAVTVTLHSSVLFVQIVCLTVAINSKSNALVPLLVSNNFVELKASVMKRFKPDNMFQVTCADAVERFKFLLFLSAILLEDARSQEELIGMGYVVVSIYFSEILVDHIKHIFLCRFNRLPAALFSKFTAVLAHDVISTRQNIKLLLDPTDSIAKRLGMAPLPLLAVVARLIMVRIEAWDLPRFRPTLNNLVSWYGPACFLAACLVLLAAKLLSSIFLVGISRRYYRQEHAFLSAVIKQQLRSPPASNTTQPPPVVIPANPPDPKKPWMTPTIGALPPPTFARELDAETADVLNSIQNVNRYSLADGQNRVPMN